MAQVTQSLVDEWKRWTGTKVVPSFTVNEFDQLLFAWGELQRLRAAPAAAEPPAVPAEGAGPSEVQQAIARVQIQYAGILRAAIEVLAAVDERHDQESPVKYTIPYGAINSLRAALGTAPAAPEPEPMARLMHWCGPAHMVAPFGGVCARTFAEIPKGKPGAYWKEGEPLYLAAPPAQRVADAPAGWISVKSAPIPTEGLVDLLVEGSRRTGCYHDRICDEWRQIERGIMIYLKRPNITHWMSPPAAPGEPS